MVDFQILTRRSCFPFNLFMQVKYMLGKNGTTVQIEASNFPNVDKIKHARQGDLFMPVNCIMQEILR